MSDAAVQFDAETHTYMLGANRLPSVTEVIRSVIAPDEYAGVSAEVLEHAAQRGRAVDRMIELDLSDELDPDSLSPEVLPYWRAWERFPERMAWRSEAPECQKLVVDAQRGYAGTLDIYLRDSRRLIDVKATALLPKTVGVQTAAYAGAYAAGNSIDPAAITRYCLHVTAAGCRLVQLATRSDGADFLAALRVYNWRQHNGY